MKLDSLGSDHKPIKPNLQTGKASFGEFTQMRSKVELTRIPGQIRLSTRSASVDRCGSIEEIGRMQTHHTPAMPMPAAELKGHTEALLVSFIGQLEGSRYLLSAQVSQARRNCLLCPTYGKQGRVQPSGAAR